MPLLCPLGPDPKPDDGRLPIEQCYLTNAVKHFKFEQRGKRRIHQRPNRAETTACHPWLAAELARARFSVARGRRRGERAPTVGIPPLFLRSALGLFASGRARSVAGSA